MATLPDIDDLAMHLDASATGSLFQDSAGTTAAGDGDPVGLWQDQSGTHDATQATDADRPTLIADAINGQPALRFASGTHLDLATHPATGTTHRDIFIVYLDTGEEETRPCPFQPGVDNTVDGQRFAILTEPGGYAVRVRGGARVFDDSRVEDAPEILCVQMHGSSVGDIDIRRCGYQLGVSSSGGPTLNTSGVGFIGGYVQDSTTDYFGGDVAEILIYTRSGGLTASEVAQVEAYLSEKYNIGLFVSRSQTASMGDGREMVKHANRLYIGAGNSSGVGVWNISSKTSPSFVIREDFNEENDFGRAVLIRGNALYLTGRNSGTLHIASLADPDAPSELGSYQSDDFIGARGIALRGDRAFVAVGHFPTQADATVNSSFQVFNIADPENITRTALVKPTVGTDEQKAGGSVALYGNYAFVSAYNWDKLWIWDISDPDDPQYVGAFQDDDLSGGRGITIRGTTLFLSSEGTGIIFALDISDPESPTKISAFEDDVLMGARNNKRVGDHLYVSCRDTKAVACLDISDPSSMSLVRAWRSKSIDNCYGMMTDGLHVYATGTTTGDLMILEVLDKAIVAAPDAFGLNNNFGMGG